MRPKAPTFAWLAVVVLLAAVADPGVAADNPLTGNLLPESDPVSMPSVARVFAGFVFTVLIAVGLVYALKRFLPRLTGKVLEPNITHKVTARLIIHSGLQIHVIEIPGHQIIVAEGKGAISLIAVPKSNADDKGQTDP
jgi:flagellar biogenesis protein FliO